MGSGTRNDSLEVVGLLLGAGADVNAKTVVSVTPRWLRSFDVLAARWQYGTTALHWAAQKNRKRVATLLLGAGADVNAETKVRGSLPFDAAY